MKDANYHEFTTLPAWTRPVWKGEKVINAADPYKWSGYKDPPAIGDKVHVYMNGFGKVTVLTYFAEHGWLGFKAKIHKPPDWWVKQNKQNGRDADPAAHFFGVDLEPRLGQTKEIEP